MRISDWSSDVCSSDLDNRPASSAPPTSAQPVRSEACGCSHTPATLAGGVAPERRFPAHGCGWRSEEHTSELQSLMRISYAVFCLKKKKKKNSQGTHTDPKV